MKYYLVALFDSESYAHMETMQKKICQKYKIYKNVPTLHITLETIEDPDMDKLNKVLGDILKPYKRFKVETNGVICCEPPYKSIKLKIESKGYIVRLARKINDTLRTNGFNVRENTDNWDLHVSLANTNYAVKEGSAREYVAASEETKKQGIYELPKIDRIELWKTTNNKKEMVVKEFQLRNY